MLHISMNSEFRLDLRCESATVILREFSDALITILTEDNEREEEEAKWKGRKRDGGKWTTRNKGTLITINKVTTPDVRAQEVTRFL
jgi:hypothetical protein